MCVIELKTHRHRDGHRSKKETVHYCHEGRKRGSLCDHVEDKSTGSAAVSEVMASSSSRPSPSPDIITTGKDGRQRQYYRISGTSTKRSSLEAGKSNSRPTSNVTSVSSSASVREVRPSTSHGERSHRRSTKYQCIAAPEQDRIDSLDGDANFERPPSLEMLEAGGNTERPHTSTAPAMLEVSPTRRPTQRRSRPKAIIVDTGASMTNTASSLDGTSPGLSNLPRVNVTRDSASDLPFRSPNARYQARVDSLADDEDLDDRSLPEEEDRQDALVNERLNASKQYQQEQISRELEARELEQARRECERIAISDQRQAERESRQAEARDEEQARIERHRLSASDIRQSDRDRQAELDRRRRALRSQEAAAQARARAEAAQRERHRQETAAALERAAEDTEHQRRLNAEYAQMARERNVAAAHAHASTAPPPQPQYYEPRSMPPSPHQITYTTVPVSTSSSPISARQMTNTYLTNPPTMSSRAASARQPVAIHNNYTSYSISTAPRDSLSERGEAVIAQTQAAAAAAAAHNRSRTSARRSDLRDEEIDAVIEAQTNSLRRQPASGWERERESVRRFERRQEYY